MGKDINFIVLALVFVTLVLLYIVIKLNKKLSELTKQANLEARYKKFLEAFPVPIFYKDNNGNVTYTNPSFDIAFGINRIKTINTLAKLLKKPLEQLELSYDNNIEKIAIIFTSALHDDEQKIDGKIGTIFDINTFKKDIISLLTWKQRYSLAIDGPGYGLWDWNILEGSFYFSNRWKNIMGYKISDKPKSLNSWLSIVDARDMAKVNEALNRHLRGEDDVFDIEHRVRLNGNSKWVNIRGKALFDKEANATRMTGLIVNISERKRAEAFSNEKQKLLSHFAQNLPGIAFIKDKEGRYIYINKYFENFIGFKEWKGKSPQELFGKEMGELILSHDKKAFYRGQKQHQDALLNAEGIKKVFETYRFSVNDENGEKFLCGFGIEI